MWLQMTPFITISAVMVALAVIAFLYASLRSELGTLRISPRRFRGGALAARRQGAALACEDGSTSEGWAPSSRFYASSKLGTNRRCSA